MTEAPVYPTAREISVAIVTAARLRREDPIATIEGVLGMRGRWFAFVALHEAFPSAPCPYLALHVGLPKATSMQAKGLINTQTLKFWWSRGDLRKVQTALAAAIAETDAELRRQIPTEVEEPQTSNAPVEPAPEKPRRLHRRVNLPPAVDLPRVVQGAAAIHDRSIGAEPTAITFPTSNDEAKVSPSALVPTAEEMRGFPAELIAELSPEAQAVASSDVREKQDTQSPVVVSSAAHALAAFQRTRGDSKIVRGSSAHPAASPVLVPNGKQIPIAERVAAAQRQENIRRANVARPGSGFDSVGDLHMRPNAPGERERATPLPPDAYGDPTPEFRARRVEADLRIAANEEKQRQQNSKNYAQFKEAHAEEKDEE